MDHVRPSDEVSKQCVKLILSRQDYSTLLADKVGVKPRLGFKPAGIDQDDEVMSSDSKANFVPFHNLIFRLIGC